MTIAAQESASSALRLIKDILFTLGAEGDECIQKLVAAAASLAAKGKRDAEAALFRAFYEGLTAQEDGAPSPPSPAPTDDAERQAAYAVGIQAARLNAACRENGHYRGWNVGPFDVPEVRAALDRAAEAMRNGRKPTT